MIEIIIMHQVFSNVQQLRIVFISIHMTIRLNAVFYHADSFTMGGPLCNCDC